MNTRIIQILLVEDNPYDAELALNALQKRHLANSIHHVEDGAEALDFIFARGNYSDRQIENGPKIILLDLKMPKVNGIEVLRQVKADERTRKIPVVVLTSSKEDPDITTCYDLGVNSYIVKPVDFDNFFRAVEDLGLYWLLLNQPPK
ncbi:MAG: response regulator [Bacteroidia bacterium]